MTTPPPPLFADTRVAGGLLFVSGQHAGTPDGPIGGSDLYEQAREALRRVARLVEAGGACIADIVKLTIYTTDMAGVAELRRARREIFREPPFPCSTLVEVSALIDSALLVEVEAVACLPNGGTS